MEYIYILYIHSFLSNSSPIGDPQKHQIFPFRRSIKLVLTLVGLGLPKTRNQLVEHKIGIIFSILAIGDHIHAGDPIILKHFEAKTSHLC